jgi:UPF0716 protein FxsA
MPLVLFLAFIVVPLIELVVIGQVASAITWGPTIVLLVVDSLIGAWLVRQEGRRAWSAFRSALAEARWPGDEVAQGALILVGGALLLTPGFVTDVAGLLMVAPPSRRALSKVIRSRMTGTVATVDGAGTRWNDARTAGARDADPRRRSGGGEVVDVEVVRVERDEPEPPPAVGSDG